MRDMKLFVLVLMFITFPSGCVFAQYEANIPEGMMNREYALKADSLGRKILAEKGNYATGIELFMRSATIYKRLGGETDPGYCNAMALLAKCYMRNDQLQDAINVLCMLSAVCKKNAPVSEQHAVILDNLSLSIAYLCSTETRNATAHAACDSNNPTGHRALPDYTETRERSGKSACLLHSYKSMYNLSNFGEYYTIQKEVHRYATYQHDRPSHKEIRQIPFFTSTNYR